MHHQRHTQVHYLKRQMTLVPYCKRTGHFFEPRDTTVFSDVYFIYCKAVNSPITSLNMQMHNCFPIWYCCKHKKGELDLFLAFHHHQSAIKKKRKRNTAVNGGVNCEGTCKTANFIRVVRCAVMCPCKRNLIRYSCWERLFTTDSYWFIPHRKAKAFSRRIYTYKGGTTHYSLVGPRHHVLTNYVHPASSKPVPPSHTYCVSL